jgi:hypothetical protein
VLHLRIIAPTTVSASARAALLDEPGATHVSVQGGAAVQPEGDVIEADVTREAVDRVLDRLLELGLDHTGGVTLQAVDTTLSDRATAAEEAVPGDPDDAVIWEQVVARTGDESRLSVSFQAFLTIACLLAAIGAVTNSPVPVVGAMVLGPEFGPPAAVAVISVTTVPAAGYAAVAAVEARWAQIAHSLGQLVVNLAGVIVAAVIVLVVARRSRHPIN